MLPYYSAGIHGFSVGNVICLGLRWWSYIKSDRPSSYIVRILWLSCLYKLVPRWMWSYKPEWTEPGSEWCRQSFARAIFEEVRVLQRRASSTSSVQYSSRWPQQTTRQKQSRGRLASIRIALTSSTQINVQYKGFHLQQVYDRNSKLFVLRSEKM